MLRTTYKHPNNYLLKSKEALRVSRAVTWLTVYRPLDIMTRRALFPELIDAQRVMTRRASFNRSFDAQRVIRNRRWASWTS